jgi:hypothetical protein
MLTVNVRTDNDAFEQDRIGELARILRELASRIERMEATGKFQNILDMNGNVVGTWKLTTD